MCGRFNVSSTPGLQALLDSLGLSIQLPPPRYNIAPTEPAPLLRFADDGLEWSEARWWLTPHWAKEVSQRYAMFNARYEGLSKSPAFRKPFARQRGIVPMSAFVEWRGDAGRKQPWLVTNAECALAVAALWDVWLGADDKEPLLSCTLVTTAAAEAFKPWHSRMPVILTEEEQRRWLDNDQLIADHDPLFRPILKMSLTLAPIAKAAGNASNKDPDVMNPVGELIELPQD